MLYRLIFFLSITLLSCQPTKESTQKPINRPNIVIIVADDQGWGDLGFNGNPIVNTPHLDQLAATGLVFDRFYVSAVCSPTRASLLTGRYAVRGGVYDTSAGGERLDLDEQTLAEYFKEAGYRTGAFGKWHNGMQPPYHPNSRGFEEFYGYCSGHWGSYFDAMLEHNGQLLQSKGYLTDVLTDKAVEFMEKHQEDPFLLYLPLNTPHSPMQVPDKWWKKFENAEIPNHRYSDRDNIDKTKAAYAMTENIDWNVGKVVGSLDKLGIRENTIVIYFSDNGPNGWRWNAGMEGIKGSVDEGGVRSPMIMNWPNRIKEPKKEQTITSVMDLLPTLLELTEIEATPDKTLDGISLVSLIEEGIETPDRLIISHWWNKISVRSQQFRLGAKDQLFDMENDPGQTTDVSEQFPTEKQRLIAAKLQFDSMAKAELPKADLRPFTVGDPELNFTQLPARDGIAHGNIKRSNRYPNCSFFTNWTSREDSITWNVEVLEPGKFEAIIYYTCQPENVGTELSLSFKNQVITGNIKEPHHSPLKGMENDRIERGESYVKQFKPYSLGTIQLTKGKGLLTLKALEIPGVEAIDFRLLMLNRVSVL